MRTFNGYVEIYCRNPDCPVRECQVRLKPDEPVTETFQCPACGRRAAIHHWKTSGQYWEESRRAARMSVNTQIYEELERRRTGSRLIPVPASVFLDDRLPVPMSDGEPRPAFPESRMDR